MKQSIAWVLFLLLPVVLALVAASDALIDRMKEAATDEAYIKAGHDIQRHVVAETMIYPGVTTLPTLQAHRAYVKGYENLHGHKVRFETTWLHK